ncbi:MAG: hypothetical protein WBG86_00580 [Polyangiales bacterium]
MLEALAHTISIAEASFESIPSARKATLGEIARFIAERVDRHEDVPLTFICTHNSRRSHIAQLWAAAGAAQYTVPGVRVFSGGTEVTAFHPNAIEAMARAGFDMDNPGGPNPHVRVRYDGDAPPLTCFSKRYDDSPNPGGGFAAVMTCAAADEACPVVHGASFRISLPFDDPKVADGTPEQETTYDRRCLQIGAEMLYVFSCVAR